MFIEKQADNLLVCLCELLSGSMKELHFLCLNGLRQWRGAELVNGIIEQKQALVLPCLAKAVEQLVPL